MRPMVPSKRPLGRFAPPRGRSSCTLMVGTRFGWAVVVVLALALALRLGYVALTPGYAIVHDAHDYDTHARSIAAGAGGLRPPRPRAVAGHGVPAARVSDPPRRRLPAHGPRDEGRRP